MVECVLDTGVLSDLLIQCFSSEDWTKPDISAGNYLSFETSRVMNQVIHGRRPGILVASTIAIVELVRRWDDIVMGRLLPYQLALFLRESPDWFAVDPIDEHLIPHLARVPIEIRNENGKIEPIEWLDAIHVATALSREQGRLITKDRRLLMLREILPVMK